MSSDKPKAERPAALAEIIKGQYEERPTNQCELCGQPGHYSEECPLRERDGRIEEYA